MSSRAHLVTASGLVRPFDWIAADSWSEAVPPALYVVREQAVPVAEPADEGPPAANSPSSEEEVQTRLAALEREAFAKGYAAGERAGLEAGARRADAMLRRLAETLEQLAEFRTTILRQSERQMVELALTLARRIVRRELHVDPDLVGALAHVALQRLGEGTPATIRLHPDDYAIVVAHRGEQWGGSQVTVIPDAGVARGGCVVESEFGVVDASLDAQFAELSRELLGEESESGGDRDSHH